MSKSLKSRYYPVPCSQAFYDMIMLGDIVRIDGRLCEVVKHIPEFCPPSGTCAVEVRYFRLK